MKIYKVVFTQEYGPDINGFCLTSEQSKILKKEFEGKYHPEGQESSVNVQEIEVPDDTRYVVEHYEISHSTFPHQHILKFYYYTTLEEVRDAIEDYQIRMSKHDKEYIIQKYSVAWSIDGDSKGTWIRDGWSFLIFDIQNPDKEVDYESSEKMLPLLEEGERLRQEWIKWSEEYDRKKAEAVKKLEPKPCTEEEEEPTDLPF